MTATTTSPQPASSPPSAPDAATGPRRSGTTDHLPMAELAMFAVSAATILGFTRLFVGWGFVWPLLALAAYTHLVSMVLRRRGVGVAMSAVVAVAGAAVVATWLWFPASTTLGIPTGRTWTAVTLELDQSWLAFRELSAPVPTREGFLVASGLAIFFAVFLADWAAFRLWAPIEAMVPYATLFVFCALLGSEQHRMLSAALFGGSVLMFVLTHRVARLEAQSGWLTSDVQRGTRWLLRTGTALTLLAVVGGLVLGPRLPGASQEALVDWRGGENGPSSRVTVSPLVDIRQRLVDQGDTEVFSVRSDRQAYWRLTALDTFDGTIWRSGGKYGEASGTLPSTVPADLPTETATQTYRITGLAALWLPAAYQPVSITTDAGVRYQPESSTLIVDTDYADSDDLTYQVTSQLPSLTPELLDAPSPSPTEEELVELQSFTALPSDFSERARAQAADAIARTGASTPYQQALALEDFFLDRGAFADDDQTFSYVLPAEASPGHGGQAIDEFLESGTGYCEQFAGTFAAMARSVGLPARVAVGFTWGDQDPNDPTLYRVKGRHAHAWPEVWMGSNVGWVAFEPTPGRGAPGMEYAGVRPQQDNGDGTSEPTTTASAPTTTTTTASTAEGGPSPEELAGLLSGGGSGNTSTTQDPSLWSDPLSIPRRAPVLTGTALLAVALIYVGAVSGAYALVRRRRRNRAEDPDSQVRVAWDEMTEELELLGVVRRPAETAAEFAQRTAAHLPDRAESIRLLAADTDAALFASTSLDAEDAAHARETVGLVSRTVNGQVPARRRVLRRLDPRPLLRRAWPARKHEQVTSGR